MLPLADHIVRIWRREISLGPLREQVPTYRLVLEAPDGPNARVNRSFTQVAQDGPGLTPIGKRRLYMDVLTDLRQRDLVQLVAGPEAPALLEVDSEVVRPRGHHLEVDCKPFNGEAPTAGLFFQPQVIVVALPPITIERGPGTTPYAAGQVFGDPDDARISITVPDLPPALARINAFSPNVPAFGFDLVMHRHAQDVVAGQMFMPVLRRGAFGTVLGDQDALVLSAADIAAVVADVQTQAPQTSPRILRDGPGGTGRYQVQNNSLVVLEPGVHFTPGGTVSLYLMLSNEVESFGPTYTPLPHEALTLYPRFLMLGHLYHEGPEA